MAQDVKELMKDTVTMRGVVERLGLHLKLHGGLFTGGLPHGA